MKRLTTLLVAAALGAVLLLPGSGNAQVPGATTLTFYEPDAGGTFRIVDNAPKSPASNPESKRFRFSVGDELVLSSPLFDRKGGTRQGTLYIVAKVVKGRTFADVKLSAQATYVLTDGSQIAAQGIFTLSKPANVAIIGGSGRYAGARGSLASVSDATSSTDTLTLLP
jgi:hypothetical protein